jgi:hypothetical protein
MKRFRVRVIDESISTHKDIVVEAEDAGEAEDIVYGQLEKLGHHAWEISSADTVEMQSA